MYVCVLIILRTRSQIRSCWPTKANIPFLFYVWPCSLHPDFFPFWCRSSYPISLQTHRPQAKLRNKGYLHMNHLPPHPFLYSLSQWGKKTPGYSQPLPSLIIPSSRWSLIFSCPVFPVSIWLSCLLSHDLLIHSSHRFPDEIPKLEIRPCHSLLLKIYSIKFKWFTKVFFLQRCRSFSVVEFCPLLQVRLFPPLGLYRDFWVALL